MSDTLKPQDLTAEERALWDALALSLAPSVTVSLECYEGSKAAAMDFILARRKLYGGPEGAKAEEVEHADLTGKTLQKFPVGHCIVCGELVAPYNAHAKYEGGYTCQPAPPPAPVLYVCPNCNEQTATKQEHEIPIRDTGICRFTCQAAPVAGELPEAVADAIDAITDAYNETDDGYWCATALEAWARSQAQPAIGMTPELERQFDRLGAQLETARILVQDSSAGTAIVCSEIEKAQDTSDAIIAAVRSQAASAQPVAVGMTPELEMVAEAANAYKLSLHSRQSDDCFYRARLNDAIAAVRAQAGKVQAVPVDEPEAHKRYRASIAERIGMRQDDYNGWPPPLCDIETFVYENNVRAQAAKVQAVPVAEILEVLEASDLFGRPLDSVRQKVRRYLAAAEGGK